MIASLPAAVRILATLCAVYIVSQFYRSSTAVIAPDLVRDIGFSPESLGLLTGAFFLAFGLTQIPLGVMLDRFGPRRTMTGMLLFAVAGALVFAGAESWAMLTLGRALMGIGCAAVFMGSVVVCARWFAPDRLATTASIVLAVGGAGNLLSATPLAYAADQIGWRDAFTAMAGITALLALAVFLLVRDAPPDHPFHGRKHETLGAVMSGIGEVLRNRRLPYLAAMAFVAYPSMATILTLWAGPYLADIHGLDGVGRGNVLLATALAMILGTLFYGPLDRRFDTRKGIAIGGALVTVVVLIALAVVTAPPLWLAVALLTLLGFFGSYSVMIMAHGRASFPEHLVGRAVTMVNFVNFTGVAVMQVLTGFIVGALSKAGDAPPEIAYRAVFGFLAATVIVALIFYRRIGDSKPSRDVDRRT